jgi:transcriptional regulator with XRE-family HTH domain
MAMITGDQVKAARNLLGWSQLRLAHETGLDPSTIAKFETGKTRPTALSVSTVQHTLEAAGVEFPDHETVRLGRQR